VHTFAELGIYEVCLTVSNENASDTYCKILDLNPVGLEEIELEEGEFLVFPNPSTDFLTIKIPDAFYKTLLEINMSTISGKTVFVQRNVLGVNQLEIELSQYPDGIYFLKAFDQNEQVFSTKVVIAKL